MELKPCPFCKSKADLHILNKGDELDFNCHYTCEKQEELVVKLAHIWFVNCPDCGACGPSFYVERQFGCKNDEEAKRKAIDAWNSQTTKYFYNGS